MSLDKSITFIASCDFCSETLDTDEDEFVSAVEAMKRNGWKVFKENNEWFHKCPDCQDTSNDFDDLL